MSGIEILLNDSRGVYIPQNFAEIYDWGLRPQDKEVLLLGPDSESYWYVWEAVLDGLTYTDKNGNVWRLYQEGDLFAFCEELMTDEERENFFGER